LNAAAAFLYFHSRFPGKPGLVSSLSVFFTCSRREHLRISGTGFLMGWMSFLSLNQQCQNIEGNTAWHHQIADGKGVAPFMLAV